MPKYAVDHSTKKGMDAIEETVADEKKMEAAGQGRARTIDEAVRDNYFFESLRIHGMTGTANRDNINWIYEVQRTLGISPYKFPAKVSDSEKTEDPTTWNPIALSGGTIQPIEKGTPMDPRKLRVVEGGQGQ
jgi:hypothetical protein